MPAIQIPDRLRRPHPIIAGWLADQRERKRAARNERDPRIRNLIKPPEFSDQDRRRHRILDALFKALERRGACISQSENRKLFAEVSGQDIQFELREKLKQVRRPLTDEERRWSSDKSRLKRELQPTGFLLFTIKTHLDAGLRHEWLEKPGVTMEDFLVEIIATLMTGGPLLAERRRAAEEAMRLWAFEQRRLEEERRRGRRLFEIAKAWRDVATAREFMAALRSLDRPEGELGDGMSISDWMLWAEQHLNSVDPMNRGVMAILEDISKVTSWTCRDS